MTVHYWKSFYFSLTLLRVLCSLTPNCGRCLQIACLECAPGMATGIQMSTVCSGLRNKCYKEWVCKESGMNGWLYTWKESIKGICKFESLFSTSNEWHSMRHEGAPFWCEQRLAYMSNSGLDWWGEQKEYLDYVWSQGLDGKIRMPEILWRVKMIQNGIDRVHQTGNKERKDQF